MFGASRFPTKKECRVLQILNAASSAMYGLDIIKASNGDVGRGTVYVLLGRLEERDLISSSVLSSDGYYESQSGRPLLPRPKYYITALGREVVKLYDKLAFKKSA